MSVPVRRILLGLGLTIIVVGVTVVVLLARSSAGHPEATELTVRYQATEQSKIVSYELRCAPPEVDGTDLVDAEAACAALESIKQRHFAPPDGGVACTEIYGGADTATVRGQLHGEPISAELSRVNGCEIARWDRLAALLPPASAGEVVILG